MCLLAQFLCTTALQYKVISNKYIYACSLSTSVILLPPIPPPVAGRLINYRFPRLAWLPTFLLRTSLLCTSHMVRTHLVDPYSDFAFLLPWHPAFRPIPNLPLSLSLADGGFCTLLRPLTRLVCRSLRGGGERYVQAFLYIALKTSFRAIFPQNRGTELI